MILKSTEYGIQIVTTLHEAAGPVKAGWLAGMMKMQPRCVYPLLKNLRDAYLVRSVAEPDGGYTHSRPGTEISLYEVVEAMQHSFKLSDLPQFSAANEKLGRIRRNIMVVSEDRSEEKSESHVGQS